ncbi:MAG: CinA family protein [Tyzzerella sp.]|nr:CinA family protein [Tyzzerella sp.]
MNLEEKIVKKLLENNYTITTAESCTGGLLAGRILNVSGASGVYNEGHITYSNEAKERLLSVSHETLETYGAVSEQTAREMAEGAAKAAKADVGLSTTGIAGPGGGTPEKPVGLVYVACHMNGETSVKECRFQGNREENRNEAVEEALELLLEMLINTV